MLDTFKEHEAKSLTDNVFKMLDNDWMLLTIGNPSSFNTMTASWGTFGYLWHRPIATVFIRPHRYTFEFAEKFTGYTLSVLPKTHRNILNFCGQNSGRSIDKIKETGLIPLVLPSGNISFEQSRLIVDCKKIYADDIKAEKFTDPEIIHRTYPSKDFHRMYIGEIVQCYVADRQD